MRHLKPAALTSMLVLLTPAMVLAHPGHGSSSFTAGFAHPFSGIDHTLAMLAIGIWAMQLGGASRWLVPLSFLATMIAGGTLAMTRVHLPLVESGILASVLIMGLILLFAWRIPAGVGAGIAGVFALFHGYAHGAEMPANSAALSYGVGFIAATATLILIGQAIGAAAMSARRTKWLRVCGVAIAAAAVLLSVGLI